MPDTYTLSVKNFRSMKEATVKIAPLTVVYGPNSSGKSSLMYGLLTLRNFLNNPNLNIPSLFSYPSISLGGLLEVVHRHRADSSISLSIGVSSPDALSAKFTLEINESGGALDLSFDVSGASRIELWPQSLGMDIAIPYGVNQYIDHPIEIIADPPEQSEPDPANLVLVSGSAGWNGQTFSTSLFTNASVVSFNVIQELTARANLPLEIARQTGFVPLRRGFSRPSYGLSNVSLALGTEDEVASLLASPTERFARYEISRFVEKISGRRIEAQGQIGTSTFSIDSIPIGKGVPASIVNDGFGINQLVYMLTICLYSPYKIVAIEEPEIHLHPSMVRELAIALAEIAVEKDRRLIVSTHSETFVVALLSQIAAGKISVDDVSFVHAENPDGSTILTQQKANRNGQIEGGLRAFMASEVKDLMDFLGLSGE